MSARVLGVYAVRINRTAGNTANIVADLADAEQDSRRRDRGTRYDLHVCHSASNGSGGRRGVQCRKAWNWQF